MDDSDLHIEIYNDYYPILFPCVRPNRCSCDICMFEYYTRKPINLYEDIVIDSFTEYMFSEIEHILMIYESEYNSNEESNLWREFADRL